MLAYKDDHGGSERIDERARPVPGVLAVLVEADEHGEGDDEVERVEGEANLVHAVEISEGVVRERFDGLGLEEGPEDGDDDDSDSVEGDAHGGGQVLKATANEAQDQVGKDVVGVEVRLRQKEADDGDLVELRPGDGEGVLGSEQREEVVRPEVVSDEVEGSDPEVGFESVTTIPDLLTLSRRNEDHGEGDAGDEDDQTDGVVTKVADALGSRVEWKMDGQDARSDGREGAETRGSDKGG